MSPHLIINELPTIQVVATWATVFAGVLLMLKVGFSLLESLSWCYWCWATSDPVDRADWRVKIRLPALVASRWWYFLWQDKGLEVTYYAENGGYWSSLTDWETTGDLPE